MSQSAGKASLFFVGARFVCTKCRTRGVTASCACGAKASAVDIFDEANAGFLRELTSPPKPEGAPTREELLWGGLKSPTQWLLSVGAAALVGIVAASTERDWSGQKALYAVAEVLLLALLFRLPMLAAALLLRLLVMLVELVLAAGSFVAATIARSERLRAAASNWLARAERALSGDYWGRRSMVVLRPPRYLAGADCSGALSPSAALRLLVTAGKHGALELCDAEMPAFPVVLSSGETISVVVDAGVVSFCGPRLDASVEKATSPLFQETRQIDVVGAERVRLVGGEWFDAEADAGYREPAPRTLRGTAARPLEIEIAEYAAGVSVDEVAALTPGRPPRSSP